VRRRIHDTRLLPPRHHQLQSSNRVECEREIEGENKREREGILAVEHTPVGMVSERASERARERERERERERHRAVEHVHVLVVCV